MNALFGDRNVQFPRGKISNSLGLIAASKKAHNQREERENCYQIKIISLINRYIVVLISEDR